MLIDTPAERIAQDKITKNQVCPLGKWYFLNAEVADEQYFAYLYVGRHLQNDGFRNPGGMD